jgi:hypothetical protein
MIMLLPAIYHQQCENEGQYFNNFLFLTALLTLSNILQSLQPLVNKLVQYNPKTLLIICNYMNDHLELTKKT